MPITIAGIKIVSLTVQRDEDGQDSVHADYQLISSTGNVLAKQSLRSKSQYGESTTFMPSHDTLKALKAAVESYKKDAEEMLGLV